MQNNNDAATGKEIVWTYSPNPVIVIHMHHNNTVHRMSVIWRLEVGPLKSGGAESFSPRSAASLDDMVFFKAVDETDALKSNI